MTSPPAKHNPPDDRPGREDADAHPPLGQVEAERHSADPFHVMAREIVSDYLAKAYGESARHLHPQDRRLLLAIAAALKSVDRAAREECARIADDIARERLRAGYFDFGASYVRDHIRQTIKD